jgi:hypothetical protein
MASFMLPAVLPRGKCNWFPLDRRLCGPQSQYGKFGEEKNIVPLIRLELLFFDYSYSILRLPKHNIRAIKAQ